MKSLIAYLGLFLGSKDGPGARFGFPPPISPSIRPKAWLRSILGALLMFCAIPASSDWHGLSLPQNIGVDPLFVRNLKDGQWLAGYGQDVLYYQPPFTAPQLYIEAEHLFNANEGGAGVFGLGLGFKIGGLATKLHDFLTALTPHDSPTMGIPPWLMSDLDKWVSVEFNSGYRLFGAGSDVHGFSYGVGGKVNAKFDLGAHH